MRIITNHVPRRIVDGAELSPIERADFDYLDWDRIDVGTESASFIRYREEVIDLGEIVATDVNGWDGIRNDSFFSGVLVRFDDDDHDHVIVGRYFA